MTVYDFTVKTRKGQDMSLSEYKGKVMLIVNTATECGFTPQYQGLQELYNKYHDKGLEIIDFPCNQFGGQAPGTSDEIHTFCTGRFGITFPQFGKIDVNGENEDPLYTYLKSEKGFAGFAMDHPIGPILDDMLSKADPEYKKDPSIKWNFTKFLVDRDGNIVARYEPTAVPESLAGAIEALL